MVLALPLDREVGVVPGYGEKRERVGEDEPEKANERRFSVS